jgi:NTE family protein
MGASAKNSSKVLTSGRRDVPSRHIDNRLLSSAPARAGQSTVSRPSAASGRIPQKRITLALQGGGSHGAFTWGALDRLLEDERIEIEGVSGASAGAINAAVLAHGLTVGGRDGARQALDTFWRSIASQAPFGLVPGHYADITARNPNPTVNALLFLAQFFSPYQLNPFNINPLRDILTAQVDFERIRRDCRVKLFIAGTRVATGTLRLFSTAELTLEALLASACIPSLSHAVEIDGESYWDGGLTANPPLRPLLYECEARDMLVVMLQPLRRTEVPATADGIMQRLAEISFSSALAVELQGIALAKREAERAFFPLGRLDRRLRRFNLHSIGSEDFMSRLSVLSKLDTEPAFIETLRDEGRRCAEEWLKKNFMHIGARSSFALDEHVY